MLLWHYDIMISVTTELFLCLLRNDNELNNHSFSERSWRHVGVGSRRQSHMFKNRPWWHRSCGAAVWAGLCFWAGVLCFQTGLPVVEGQDLERGGPASAGEVERAAGNRGAAGLHSAPTRHRYADTLCRSLSFCLSVRPSAPDGPGSAQLAAAWFDCGCVVLSCVCVCVCV